MVSLREKQKERREQSILAAATELLELKGYRNTSIEEIAEKAEVGVGTVYNYFHSKSELVLALTAEWHKEMLEKGQVFINNPPDDPVEAIVSLFYLYIEVGISKFSKSLLMELTGITFTEQFFMKEHLKMDYDLIAQLTELIKKIKSRGHLARGIKPEEAVSLLYMVLITYLILFMSNNEMTLEAAIKTMKDTVCLIFTGLAPK
ncbi:TetR/AcrR family transcriptional regulator [Chloroflexota bacterium]